MAPAIGATVRVCQPGATGQPCTPLEVLYTNQNFTQVQPFNPLTTDSYGNYTFCAKDSTVYLETTYKGTVKIQPTYVIASSGGGGGTGGGIQTINSNSNPNQVITQGSGINVASSGGTTTISATGGGGGGGSVLLASLTLNPTTVAGGNTSAGIVTLTAPAPAGGVNVSLSSSNTGVAQPGSSANVSGGSTTGTFNVATTAVGSDTNVTISGTLGLTQSANLLVTAPPPPPQPIYGGVGAAGANGTVVLNGTNVTLSTGDVIPQLQTTPEQPGNSWSFSPNNQVIYLLLVGGSHTFVDQNGFLFVMNAPIAANLGGRSMFLYQSTNALVGPFTVRVQN